MQLACYTTDVRSRPNCRRTGSCEKRPGLTRVTDVGAPYCSRPKKAWRRERESACCRLRADESRELPFDHVYTCGHGKEECAMQDDNIDERLRLPLLSSLAAPASTIDAATSASAAPSTLRSASPSAMPYSPVQGGTSSQPSSSFLAHNDYLNRFASMNALASTSQQAYDIPTSQPYSAPPPAATPVPGGLGTKRKDSGGNGGGSGSEAGGHEASEAAKAEKGSPGSCDSGPAPAFPDRS